MFVLHQSSRIRQFQTALIFDDKEHKIIGTIYKQESTQIATDKGLEIFSQKLPELYKQYEKLSNEKVVFCWRGGMRSKETATFLSLMGVKCYRLKGGYRAYRNWVVEQLESFEVKPKCVVVNGLTGSGKTKILQALSEEGYPVLDLEEMAKHRGSVFGHIGLKPNNQKTFETELVNKLIQHNEAPYVLMEASEETSIR